MDPRNAISICNGMEIAKGTPQGGGLLESERLLAIAKWIGNIFRNNKVDQQCVLK